MRRSGPWCHVRAHGSSLGWVGLLLEHESGRSSEASLCAPPPSSRTGPASSCTGAPVCSRSTVARRSTRGLHHAGPRVRRSSPGCGRILWTCTGGCTCSASSPTQRTSSEADGDGREAWRRLSCWARMGHDSAEPTNRVRIEPSPKRVRAYLGGERRRRLDPGDARMGDPRTTPPITSHPRTSVPISSSTPVRRNARPAAARPSLRHQGGRPHRPRRPRCATSNHRSKHSVTS